MHKQIEKMAEENDRPPGFTLRHTLRGHEGTIHRIAWSPDGRMLASPSTDTTIRLWDAEIGKVLKVLEEQESGVYCVAWSPSGKTLVSVSRGKPLRLWDTETGRLIQTLEEHEVSTVAWSPNGTSLASGSRTKGRIWVFDAKTWKPLIEIDFAAFPKSGDLTDSLKVLAWSSDGKKLASNFNDCTVRLWNTLTGNLLLTLEGHDNLVFDLAWSPDGKFLASASTDQTVIIWDIKTGKKINVLEAHTGFVLSVSFSVDGRLLASFSADNTVRLWRTDTWLEIATLHVKGSPLFSGHLTFHPISPSILAILDEKSTVVHIWDLDLELLLGAESTSVLHTTAKVVLVGDSGVGKTGLGWRLAHDEFKELPSTHGQQFWILDQLKAKRKKDGADCEAVLWDLAGQPDYRLIHGLFLDDADLALVLFDPANRKDPFSGVDFWLKSLAYRGMPNGDDTTASNGEEALPCRTILVGARIDRGVPPHLVDEIDRFCDERGITGGYVGTSALSREGIDALIERMKEQVAWEDMVATTTTTTFKRIKKYVLGLKEDDALTEVLTDWPALREQLEALDDEWTFTDAEMTTAVGHLAKYGYVRVLRTASGEERVLLAPELLNNLAASYILEARRNPKGLGALDEKGLLSGTYRFPELADLNKEERDTLLNAANALFLWRNVCLREALGAQTLLIFPELINLRNPHETEQGETEEDVAYTVSGAVENVYAALVVLLGYTNIFRRTRQWQHEARYEMAEGRVCGFRQIDEREGELEFVLYYGKDVISADRFTFQSLFERILASRDVTVKRYAPLRCEQGHLQPREDISRKLRRGKHIIFCEECEDGKRITIPDAGEPIALSAEEHALVERERAVADRRTGFETALTRITGYVRYLHGDAEPPTCFVSYAWGVPVHERWVAESLVDDLSKAGIDVTFDRQDNAETGKNIARFIDLIPDSDWVIVVGTPLYVKKYKNQDPETGSMVAAEMDLILQRMTGTEAQKESVLPVLLDGTDRKSFPNQLKGRVYSDFRDELDYFAVLFDLILRLYRIPITEPALAEIRAQIHARGMRVAHLA